MSRSLPSTCRRWLAAFERGRTMNEPQSEKLVLKPAEAARALGISPRLLWQLTADGVIPCMRVGTGKRKRLIYPIALLNNWLEENTTARNGGAQ